uniref:CRAL-TRIO domain-containing protein n=1 Tax=Rodentolepis nana TaxID=102285 RepID=A0A0R3TU64_RODNA
LKPLLQQLKEKTPRGVVLFHRILGRRFERIVKHLEEWFSHDQHVPLLLPPVVVEHRHTGRLEVLGKHRIHRLLNSSSNPEASFSKQNWVYIRGETQDLSKGPDFQSQWLH